MFLHTGVRIAAATVVGIGLAASGVATAQPLVGPSNATHVYNPVVMQAHLTPDQAIPPSGGSGTGDCIAFIDRYWTEVKLYCATEGGRDVDRLDFWIGAPSTTGFAFFSTTSTRGSPFNLGMDRPPGAFENGTSDGVFVHAFSNGVPELGGWFDRADDPWLTYFQPDDTTTGMDCKVITTTNPSTIGIDCLPGPDGLTAGSISRTPASSVSNVSNPDPVSVAFFDTPYQLGDYGGVEEVRDGTATATLGESVLVWMDCWAGNYYACLEMILAEQNGSLAPARAGSSQVDEVPAPTDAAAGPGRYKVTAVSRDNGGQDLRFFALWFGHDAARAYLDPDGLGYQWVLGASVDRVCTTGYDFTATYHGSDPNMVLDVTVTDSQTGQQQVLTVGGTFRHDYRQGCP